MNQKAKLKTNKPKSFPIVGIGASAGGLHSLECFLAALPKKFCFALVFLQHLSPKHKSLLPDLVRSRNPHLDSEELSDGTRAHPGKLYLCPPAKEISLQNGVFSVGRLAKAHVHLPIDEFFISLAEDAEENAIAVIFSGAGTDGARGIQTIKAMGGTVLVQDPATAEFKGMPLAAINTGQVDSVLSPDDIAREIVKMHETGKAATSPDSLLTPAQFEIFFRLIHQKTGLWFNHYKKNVVSRRIRRRMYLHGISSVQDYAQLVSGENTEAELLASDLMIGVTSFFRDRVAWKALTLEVVRKLVAENSDAPIRVWSPACATGEEPYSIAMLLSRELRRADKKREIQVFATDVNDRALEKARQGIYPASIAADVPPDYLKEFFTSSENKQNVIVNKEIRELVVFAKQNLLNDPPFSRLDLVICRNLLIYLEPEAQNKCIVLFHYALKDGGYLFLGNAESTGSGKTLLKSLGHKKCRIYRKTETKPAARMPFALSFTAERATSLTGKRTLTEEYRRSTAELIQEALLGEYAPAAVAVNQNHDIVYHNGPTSRYLRQPRGTPTQNLLELLPENLRNRIRGGLYRAVQDGKPISIRVQITGDEAGKKPVTLRISKLQEDLILITFHEKHGTTEQPEVVDLEAAVAEGTAVRQLEAELSTTKQELQSHIEQLKGLNEEFQSSNEELQAANEELETSREELQSLNEELLTVNTELQSKIEEVEETNNDLSNFLTSTSIPTLFLDHEFRVKRFTPAMSRLVKLIPSDVGRQIIDMSQESLGPDLVRDSQSVLDTLVPVKQETTIDSTSFIRTILPYRTADNRIEGVVITYNDVTDLKRSEERTKHLASFPQLNPNPVIEADASGKILYYNPAAEKVLRDLGMEGEAYNAFLPTDVYEIFGDLEKKKEAPLYRELRIKDRVFGATIQLIPRFNALRVYAFDITRRKQAEEKLILAKEEWERTFDSVPDLIAIIDNQHRVRRVNKAMAQRLGRTPEECVGLPCYEVVHGTSVPHEFCPHALTLKDRKLHVQEVNEKRLGGDFLVSTTPLYDAQGKLTGSAHVAHDITERKRMEEANAKLAALVESSDDAIISKDLDGVILSWNMGAQRLFGYKSDEVIGKSITLLLPPELQEEEKQTLLRLSAGERIEHFDTVRVAKDGKRIEVSVTASPIKDSTGRIIGASKIARDITERKLAEEALHLSEQKFAKAFASNPSAIALTRLEDGLFLEVNDTWVALTGYSREEAIGHSARKMQIWSNAEAAARFVQTLREKGSLRGCEENFLKKSGEVYVAVLSAQILTMRGEKVVLSTLVDITERKLAEETLRKANDRLEMALRASNAGTWDWDVKTGRIEWSRELFVLLGLDPAKDAATFELWETALHPDDREEAGVRIDRALKDKTPLDSEYRIVKPDGHISWINALGVGQYDHQNRPVRMTGLCIDVTKRKQAEEQIRKYLADLRANSEELERFNRAAVDRELRMVELKKEINELCSKTGETQRYNLDFEKG